MAIPRNVRPRAKRKTLRRGELSREQKQAMRKAIYERAGGVCELQISCFCVPGVLPLDGDTPWNHGHAVHLKSVGSGGKWTMENLRWGCHICHLIELHNPKPCPKKVQ